MSIKINIYITILMLSSAAFISPLITKGQSTSLDSSQQETVVQKKYGLDPSKPLAKRIGNTPPEIIQKFRDAGMSPTIHRLSKTDSLKVVRAFQMLPPLHQHILKEHLLGISFLDNMPNTALTATINPEDQFPVFTITFRAEILKQDVSQWLTEKEMSYFTKDFPGFRIAIEAGKLDAILYVLLHEATHVVDGSLGILAMDQNKGTSGMAVNLKSFTRNIWVDRTSICPSYTDSLTSQSRFRGGGRLLPMELARQIYQSAAKGPFVSLYATSSWHEDLAEYLTVTHFTKRLKQPFRIIIHEDQKEIFIYEPMKSATVSSRISLMKYFYAKAGSSVLYERHVKPGGKGFNG